MSLSEHLKRKGVTPRRKRTEPLWKGPEVDGITFSMLSRFLTCRERFRVAVIEGLRPADTFNHRIEYGQMWHVCEESYADGGLDWVRQLNAYCQGLLAKYPLAAEQIEKWMMVCLTQFQIYLDYWRNHDDEKSRVNLLHECVFDVPYELPSGRTVRLRGKWDGVDLISEGRRVGLYLMEHKTKGDVDVRQLQRQLTFDLQTMLYLTAMHLGIKDFATGPVHPVLGVRYNVVRRPLSGGKGSIVQRKGSKNVPAETTAEYYARLGDVIRSEPGEFFWRWKVDVAEEHVNRFRIRCLDPLLEQVCDWYDWVKYVKNDPFISGAPTCDPQRLHWQHPFGVRNTLDEGGHTDLDEYLETGSEVGLRRVDKLFTELE